LISRRRDRADDQRLQLQALDLERVMTQDIWLFGAHRLARFLRTVVAPLWRRARRPRVEQCARAG